MKKNLFKFNSSTIIYSNTQNREMMVYYCMSFSDLKLITLTLRSVHEDGEVTLMNITSEMKN